MIIQVQVSSADDNVTGRWMTEDNGATWHLWSWGSNRLRLSANFDFFTDDVLDAQQHSGVRFQNVPVEQGAEILSATLTMYCWGPSGDPIMRIYGDNVDDAPAWDQTNSNMQDHLSRTTAFTEVTTFAASANDTYDVTDIIQEIVNRPGWQSGNSLRLGLLNAKTKGARRSNHDVGWRRFEDGFPPTLTIELPSTGFSGIYLGNTQINAMHVGSKEIVAAYLGNTKIFEKA